MRLVSEATELGLHTLAKEYWRAFSLGTFDSFKRLNEFVNDQPDNVETKVIDLRCAMIQHVF